MQLQSQVDTLVPLLYARYGLLKAAMGKAMETLRRSVADFDLSAQELLGRHAMDADLQEKLQKYVHGCKCACTANLQ